MREKRKDEIEVDGVVARRWSEMKDEENEKGIRLRPLEIAEPRLFRDEMRYRLVEIPLSFCDVTFVNIVMLFWISDIVS